MVSVDRQMLVTGLQLDSFDLCLRDSHSRAHNNVSRTSHDGSWKPSSHSSADAPRLPTLPTPSSHLLDAANRNAFIVASLSGRARFGLQVKSFRRELILKVDERVAEV